MANKQKLTVFQRLGLVTSPDYPKIAQKLPQPQRYNMGSDVLLKTDEFRIQNIRKT